MELVKVKVRGTGDVVIMEKVTTFDGEAMYIDPNRKLFKANEVEYLEPFEQPEPEDPMVQFPMEMINKVTEMVNGYVDHFERMYWQRQRVEFTKIFLQRNDLNKNAGVEDIVSSADEFVKYLRETEL